MKKPENPPKTREKFAFSLENSEIFVRDRDGKPQIGGYAAMYNRLSEDLGGFRVKIEPGAFDKVLAGVDCRLLVNHDNNLVFGRTKSGTLRIFGDDKGLGFEGDPPDTPLAAHYVEAIRRGDMDGCSFQCTIEVDQWDWSGDVPIRTLMRIGELYDVGPVTFPAFPDTSVVAHSLELARAARVPRCSLDLMRLRLALAR